LWSMDEQYRRDRQDFHEKWRSELFNARLSLDPTIQVETPSSTTGNSSAERSSPLPR
jgi:hypothetical protein